VSHSQKECNRGEQNLVKVTKHFLQHYEFPKQEYREKLLL